MCLKLSNDIIINRSDDQLNIYSIEDEKIFKLNSTAEYIIGLFNETKELAQDKILEKVQNHFQSPNINEIKGFLQDLIKLNILIKTN